jgi:hypothetical protein
MGKIRVIAIHKKVEKRRMIAGSAPPPPRKLSPGKLPLPALVAGFGCKLLHTCFFASPIACRASPTACRTSALQVRGQA